MRKAALDGMKMCCPQVRARPFRIYLRIYVRPLRIYLIIHVRPLIIYLRIYARPLRMYLRMYARPRRIYAEPPRKYAMPLRIHEIDEGVWVWKAAADGIKLCAPQVHTSRSTPPNICIYRIREIIWKILTPPPPLPGKEGTT